MVWGAVTLTAKGGGIAVQTLRFGNVGSLCYVPCCATSMPAQPPRLEALIAAIRKSYHAVIKRVPPAVETLSFFAYTG